MWMLVFGYKTEPFHFPFSVVGDFESVCEVYIQLKLKIPGKYTFRLFQSNGIEVQSYRNNIPWFNGDN